MRQAGVLQIDVTAASLDRAAGLVCAYDPENDHPRDVVRSILEAMAAHPCPSREKEAQRPVV